MRYRQAFFFAIVAAISLAACGGHAQTPPTASPSLSRTSSSRVTPDFTPGKVRFLQGQSQALNSCLFDQFATNGSWSDTEVCFLAYGATVHANGSIFPWPARVYPCYDHCAVSCVATGWSPATPNPGWDVKLSAKLSGGSVPWNCSGTDPIKFSYTVSAPPRPASGATPPSPGWTTTNLLSTITFSDGTTENTSSGNLSVLVLVPTPTPSPPFVQITSLNLAGTNSSVGDRLGPITDKGHFTLSIIPTSGAPQKIFGGQRLGGTYTDLFSCWKLPQGDYTGVDGMWNVLGKDYEGALQQAFTIPSKALLQHLAAAARGGQLTSAAQKALPYVFKAFAKDNMTNPNQMAAIIAEIDHEDNFGSLNGGVEAISKANANEQYGGIMGNGSSSTNDGYTYRGRGDVQVTGRTNYKAFADKYGVDVVKNPALLLSHPDLDAQNAVDSILNGSFTGAKLSTYVNGNSVDFFNARRTVNGVSSDPKQQSYQDALNIDRYSRNYASILQGGC